jgi:hydroxyethylthiazole kinase-like uncharacterized protein yjeF
MKIISAQAIRELDALTIKKAGIPGRELMLRAGVCVAKEILSYIGKFIHKLHVKRFVILAGKGNNGGDGYVVADYLAQHTKVPVVIYPICSKQELSSEATYYADKLFREVKVVFKDLIASDDFCAGDIIIDGLLGTGFCGSIKPRYKDWIATVNSSGYPVISIDIPSGIDGTTGDVIDMAIIADLTVTIGLPKRGLFVKDGPSHVGLLKVVDIGIPREFVAKINSDLELFCYNDAGKLLMRVSTDSHKKSVGTVVVIGGSKCYKGAPILSGMAALRTGAGLVTVAVPKLCAPSSFPYNALIVREVGDNNYGFFDSSSISELSELIKSHDAIVIGPGIGTNHFTEEVVRTVLSHDKKMIIDADALNLISSNPDILKRNEHFIFTPHAGEIMRLLVAFAKDVNFAEDRVSKVEKATTLLGGTVILKGNKTIVSHSGKTLSVNNTGSQALATAGTGDVLSGIIGAFTASGLDGFDASRIAVYLHGFAGELVQKKNGIRGTIADDIIEAIPEALRTISPFA